MTKQEAIEKLLLVQKNGDTEAAHGEADEILCQLLRHHGFGDVVDEFEKVDKWYA